MKVYTQSGEDLQQGFFAGWTRHSSVRAARKYARGSVRDGYDVRVITGRRMDSNGIYFVRSDVTVRGRTVRFSFNFW
jgi:hypothetical protein